MSNPALTFQPAAQASAQAAQGGQTRAAIANAAQRTGVDFSYLLAQARIESGMDPMAEARTSSASGLYQFIDQTWLATLDRHGEQLGYGQMAQAIDTTGGVARIVDPGMREAIMSLRFDPQASALMAGALANDNRAALTPALGREPDSSELYLAHFLGADGANRFLTALNSNPDGSAAAILPRAANANRAIFYERSGAPHSVADVMELVRGKVDAAIAQGGDPALQNPGWYPVQDAAAPNSARRVPAMQAMSGLPGLPSLPTMPTRPLPSMADTLQNSFALGSNGGSIPGSSIPGQAHVRSAYARLQAFGL